jgi:hypothetical protein
MTGLLPKRRAQPEIERADSQLLRKHEAYLEAWVRADERSAAGSGSRKPGSKREADAIRKPPSKRG